MEKQIAELIREYSSEPKPVDSRFWGTIFTLLVKQWKLEDYTSKIESNTKEEIMAPITYDAQTGIVSLNHYSLDEKNREIDFYYRMFDREEAIAYYNATMVQYLLHAIEHVKQIKRRETATDNSFETRLIRVCRQYFMFKTFEGTSWDYTFKSSVDFRGLEVPNDLYIYDPMERLASIRTFETMVKIINSLKDIYPNLLEFEEASFIESLLSAYPDSFDCGLCPTQIYLDSIGLSDVWDSTGFNTGNYNYDVFLAQLMFPGPDGLADRLKYGLPISSVEYDAYDVFWKGSKKYEYINKKKKNPDEDE